MIIQLWYRLYPILHPLFIGLCMGLAWGMVGLFLWNIGAAIAYSLKTSQRMHQIPCSQCQYFTGDYRLKCTLHPSIALSDAAIHCADFAAPATLTLEISEP
ncbi:MAG: hypothetical protein HC934_04925 [Acaryochloridaceae cyanobacterium SU_2_1]|nr:hypothetical protein [Acaryochloridaceae cyanobacterium SU_2_1]NJM95085.1 hypothetical protein [Acaryochloridaceae cyanobacterium CSU_5_19]